MKHSTDPEKAARETRDLAKRARRLAQGLLAEADRESLYRFADELDQRVAELQAEAATQPTAPTGPVVVHEQQQVQQQAAEPAPDPAKPKTKT